MNWLIEKNGFHFVWDIASDQASLTAVRTSKIVWRGTRQTAFDLPHQGSRVFHKARAAAAAASGLTIRVDELAPLIEALKSQP